MKRTSQFTDLLMPWTGLAVGVVAAGVVDQFGSAGTFDHCRVISPIPLIVVALIGIAVTIAAAFVSWRVLRDRDETQARKVIAIISVGSAALFVMAMMLPVIASLVIPPCFQ
jgi:uncharacterized membrane protein YidH (DUF202 family)